MLLHRKNIDLCRSLKLGKDKHGHALKIRIDKLTIVSYFSTIEEKEEVYNRFEEMRQGIHEKYRVKYIRNKEKKPYRKSLRNKLQLYCISIMYRYILILEKYVLIFILSI